MEKGIKGQVEGNEPVLLTTNPDSKGFIFKYILCLTPVFLVIISWIVRIIIYGIITVFFPSLISSLTRLVPNMNDVTNGTVLLIAPIGIFVFGICIGWALRLPEVWTGLALALATSGVIGVLLVRGVGAFAMSANSMIDLLQWIGFLIQPLSVIAAVIIIAWTEQFRRSIRYTITKEGLRIKGGVWRQQEHMIPHHLIGRVVMEQDRLASLFQIGTIIPLGTTPAGPEMSLRGMDAGGLEDNARAGLRFARERQEGSRYPLDCLYGIREPQKAMALLEKMIYRPAEQEEEQVSSIKKNFEKI